MTLRLGIAGLGAAGAHMLSAALRHPAVAVQAVADIDPVLLEVAGGRVEHRYKDFRTLCDDDRVDAIYVASPTELHVSQVLAAFAAGKDVVVEKPMSIDLAGARRAIDAASDSGRVLVVGHSMSFEPYVRAVSAAVTEHSLGRPLSMVLHEETDWMRRPRLPEELDATVGGGPILRQGAHLVDTARYLNYGGCVTGVSARGLAFTGERCHGSFVATMSMSRVPVTIVYNGHARMRPGAGPQGVETAAEPLAGARSEDRKLRRNVDALRRALAEAGGGRVAPPVPPVLRRFLLVYERGQVTVDNETVDVLLPGGSTVQAPTAHYPPGRHAVLDELIAARAGVDPLHDGAWGFENLRVCLEVVAAASLPRRCLTGTSSGSHGEGVGGCEELR